MVHSLCDKVDGDRKERVRREKDVSDYMALILLAAQVVNHWLTAGWLTAELYLYG